MGGRHRPCNAGATLPGAKAALATLQLPDATARSALIRTLRAVVDWRGQVVTMLDRSYLVRALPTLLVWGTLDSVLPIGHGYRAHAAMPGSRLEVFVGAGHFPFRTDPNRFVDVVEDFLATTEPSQWGVEAGGRCCGAGVRARSRSKSLARTRTS